MNIWESLQIKATWDTAFINSLPDSSFASIEAGGKKDENGLTTPRSLRHYPHHGKQGGDGPVDLPHLRAALSRIADPDNYQGGKAHLEHHAEQAGIGDRDDGKGAPGASEVKAGVHGAYSGTHSHAHAAFGSQGDDGMHAHEHTHDGDASHDHEHSKAALTEIETKRGARHSGADRAHLTAMHDHLHRLLNMTPHDLTDDDGSGDDDPTMGDDGMKALALRLRTAELRARAASLN